MTIQDDAFGPAFFARFQNELLQRLPQDVYVQGLESLHFFRKKIRILNVEEVPVNLSYAPTGFFFRWFVQEESGSTDFAGDLSIAH